MTTLINASEKVRIALGSHDCLSKQGARAVMFVLLLAFLMALSAIFLILSSDGSGTASAQQLPDTRASFDQPVPQKPTKAPKSPQGEIQTPA